MNLWAQMLSETPASLQRLIARTQRVSLPRGCPSDERMARLRRSLCHAATVRVTYATLDTDCQLALQDLRDRRGGASFQEIEQQYGRLRSWTQLAADPRPRTVAERLVLLGWLIPRSATPRHPARFLLPPELRRWLPRPLQLPERGAAPSAPAAPVLRAAATILLAAAEQPLALRAGGLARARTVRLLAHRLSPEQPEEVGELVQFLLPLLRDLGLVADHHGACVLAPAGQRFLDLPPAEQLARLRAAWIAAPAPDRALAPLLARDLAIDWPLLRRRLCQWAGMLPEGQLYDVDELYSPLAAALGPLADAQTHGFRRVDRVPLQPRRAAALFAAAIRGPLHWLGEVACFGDVGMRRRYAARIPAPIDTAPTACWRYGPSGQVIVPHSRLDAAVLRLLPFSAWHATGAEATTYVITPARLAQAAAKGYTASALWALLEQQAGPPPPGWSEVFEPSSSTVRIAQAAVVLAEPALLERASRARSVRRYLGPCLAPGIALLEPENAPALARALDRQQLAVDLDPAPPAPAPAHMSPGEAAALLLACAFYRRHAPPDAPYLPADVLEERLRAALTPELRAATGAVCSELIAPPEQQKASHSAATMQMDPVRHDPGPSPSPHPTPLVQTLPLLRRALVERRAVTIIYPAAHGDTCAERTVRPLALERRGGAWYLRAYCLTRAAERTFRVDRIVDAQIIGRRPRDSAPDRFPDASLTADHDVRQIFAHLPESDNLDPRDGRPVEHIETHTVAVEVDHAA